MFYTFFPQGILLIVNSMETSVCLMQILSQSICMIKAITSLLVLCLNRRNTRTSSPGPSRPGQVSLGCGPMLCPGQGSSCCSRCSWGRRVSDLCKRRVAGLLYEHVARWIIRQISCKGESESLACVASRASSEEIHWARSPPKKPQRLRDSESCNLNISPPGSWRR